jgi:cell division septum initiation protein DivIVA
MATAVDELLDMLFDMIDEAKNAPLSSDKCIIERDKALDLVEDIKAQFPVELAEAKKILNARNEYVAAAKREADEIRKRAEIEATQMTNEAQIMNRARQKANELMAQAEQKAKEVRRSANEYCVDILRRTEEALADAHEEMRQTHGRFRSAMNAASTPAPAGNSRLYDAEADE